MTKEDFNEAFIDGQNLYMNVKAHGWSIDLHRFRVYLREKWHCEKAYYFLGAVDETQHELYNRIQDAGFILIFREHSQGMAGKKKGNVDTDIVFTILSKIIDGENFDKVLLVSGDGDYFKMVHYLIEKNRFLTLLAPNEKSTSTLYKRINPGMVNFLDRKDIRKKIELK